MGERDAMPVHAEKAEMAMSRVRSAMLEVG